jgi:hypothetical protein
MTLVRITNSNVESALELINLASEQGLTDVSPIIYRSLESPIQSNESLIKLEDSLIKLARWTKKDLFFDYSSQHFIIKGEPTSDKYGDEIHERSDIIARFELTDDLKQIKISSDFEGIISKKNKTLELADFINKNNEAISALNQHMKIHDELAKINPALKTHSSFKPEISGIKLSFDYLDKDPRKLISYFNINDESGAGSHQSQNNNILEILPDNKFRLKHINRELDPVEFFTEVEKIKKLSDLAKFVKDKFSKDSPGARVTRMENPSNPLLPTILIQNGDHSYMINSDESITIKAPGGSKTTEKLEDFVYKLKNPSPLVSSDGIAGRVSLGELVK